MSDPAPQPHSQSHPAPPAWLPRLFVLACVVFSAQTLSRWDAFRHATFFNRWPLFDWQDIHVYFESSRWMTGAGTLYRQVPSEYPLLPNLLFGAVRMVSNAVPLLPEAYDRFAWVWVSRTRRGFGSLT